MDLELVEIEKPEEMNFILGQSHFIKTVEDIHEALVQTVPGIEFGLAFCEASGPCLIRHSGTDDDCRKLAIQNVESIAAGHSFIVFLKNAFPINILQVLRQVPEICRIFCATANPTQVIIGSSEQGRGILGVIDGFSPKGVETDADIQARQTFLRQIGYKLG